MERPKSNKRKLIMALATTAFVVVFCFTLFFEVKNVNKPSHSKPSDSLTYDIDDPNKRYNVNNMLFDYDLQTKTATFKGISTSPTSTEITLFIPENVYNPDGIKCTVTKVALPDDVKNSVEDKIAYYSKFSALIIPDTVTNIEMAALAGFSKLEYLKTPLVGQVIDDVSSSDTLKDNPFGSMFSYPTPLSGSTLEYDIDDPNNSLYNYQARSFIIANLLPSGYQVDEIWYPVNWYSSRDFSTSQTRFYIPNTLKKVVVTKDTSLCNRAFSDCGVIQEVVLPDTMTDLNSQFIFYGMNEKKLFNDNGYYEHSETEFVADEGLKSITLPKTCGGLGIGFLGKNWSLTDVELPERLLEISEGCFYNCQKLTNVEMPSTVKTIADGAFSKCSALENIKIFSSKGNFVAGKEIGFNLPDVVETIGTSSFAECSKFTSVTITSAKTNTTSNGIYLQSIGASAFTGCQNIVSLTLPFIGKTTGGLTKNSNGVYVGSKETCFGWVFGGAVSGISYWDNYEKNNSSGIGGTSQSTSFTQCQIGEKSTDVVSFYIPTKLSSLTITGETQICPGALQGLNNLTSLTLNKDITYIANAALRGANGKGYSLQSLTIPFIGANSSTGSKINVLGALFGTEAFGSGSGTGGSYAAKQAGTTYYIPSSLTTIEVTNASRVYTGALNNVTKLVNCTIDYVSSGQVLESKIFHNNPKLSNLTLPFIGITRGSYYNYYYSIYGYSYGWWYYGRVHDNICWVFSNEQGSADDYWYSPYHDTVKTKNNTTNYGEYKRYVPSSLKNLTITNESQIERYAMHGLMGVEEITISDETTKIANGAFAYLDSLKAITLPFIGTYNQTLGTSKYENTFISIFDSKFSDDSEIVSNNFGSTYIPNSLRTITISNQNTKIPSGAFMNLINVETISFLNGENEIDSLGSYAFYGCENLRNLNWPSRVFTTVGDYAFYGCKVINKNDIKNLLSYQDGGLLTTTIGDYAFASTNLISSEDNPIDFTSFFSIGNYAFYDCPQITYANIDKQNYYFDSFGEGVFANCTYLKKVEVGYDISDYLFKDCISLEGPIDLTRSGNTIPKGMFMNCKSLQFSDLSLSNSIITIDNDAFNGCESLGKFTIGENVERIGSGAFSNCLNLAPITIPRSVTTIEPNAFNNNGTREDFYFWVYSTQKNWPAGWVDNWNCDYLVYVLGTADPDIFTYEYNLDLNGYLITGMVAGNNLIGEVQFPEYRNGIKIKGIHDADNPNNNLKIRNQKITRAVIPANYSVLDDGLFGNKTDRVKHTVELFLEHDDELAKSYFGSDPTDWNFLGQGIVYTAEYWRHSSSVNDPIVELDSSKFEYEIDSNSTKYLSYDGTAKTINLKTVKKIGYVYGDYDTNLPLDIFDLSYENNVLAGNARVITSINATNLDKYNKDRTSKNVGFVNEANQPISIKFSEDVLFGQARLTFKINKKRITVYPSQTSYTTTFNETKFYYLTEFNNSNVDGLYGTEFTLSGRLRPNSLNVGVYTASDEINGDFVWDRLVITRNGSNVTDNFDIYIGDLTVTINPKEVIAGFTNGEWSTGKWQTGALLFFPYIGRSVSPEVLAYDTEGNRVTYADGYLYINLNTAAPVFPTYDRSSGKPYSNSASEMTVGMRNTKNYVLRYYDGSALTRDDANQPNGKNEYDIAGNRIQSYTQEYWVVKGKITIRYRNLEYVIPMNADCWSLDDFSHTYGGTTRYFTITGLGESTKIQARLYNVAVGGSPTNAKGSYSYSQNQIVFDPQTYEGRQYDYLILRETNDGYVVDNDYYDIDIECEVTINYNQFELSYYIDGVRQSPSRGKDVSGNDILMIRFEADGLDHTFTASDERFDSTNQPENYSIIYLKGEGKEESPIPFVFKEITKTAPYAVGVRFTAKNFDTAYANLYIEVVKGNVIIDSLSKEYDATPVSVKDKLVKYDKFYQQITCEEYEKYESGKWVKLSTAPYQVGYYRLHVKVEYPLNTDEKLIYFNDFDDVLYFDITRRTIEIDITGNKPYDGNVKEWEISPTNTEIYDTIQSRLLNGDVLIGAFETNSPNEGNYSSGSIIWSIKPNVTNTNTNFDNTSNYDIIITGVYTIDLLQIQYNALDYEGEYDGNFHSISVRVSQSVPNYEIRFSGENTPANNLLNPSYVNAKASPFGAEDLEYTVNFTISAPHYETVYDSRIVKIRRKTITASVSDEQYPWDSLTHSPQEPTVTPSYAYKYYSWILLDDTGNAIAPQMPSEWPDTNSSWSMSVPQFVDPGTYQIFTLFAFDNYKAVIESSLFTIGDYKDVEGSEVTATGMTGTYHGEYNSNKEWVETEYKINVTTTLNPNSTTIYYSTNENVNTKLDDMSWIDDISWSTTNPTFTQAGKYTVYVKVISVGRKPYRTSADVIINKDVLPDVVSASNVDVVFDSLTHSIEIHNENQILDNYYNSYIGYSIDPNSYKYKIDDSFDKNFEKFQYKNVGTYNIYVAVIAPNYETRYLSATLTITQATIYGKIELDDNQFQYSAKRIETSNINVSLVDESGKLILDNEGHKQVFYHDGVKIARFYNASVQFDGSLLEDKSSQINAPVELGYYYVEITYRQTQNCTQSIVSGFIQIKPRELKLVYEESNEYTGYEQMPAVSVDSGTSDIISVIAVEKDGRDVVDIGTYHISVSLNMQTGKRSNYILDIDEFEYRITPIKIYIGEVSIDENQAGNNKYSAIGVGIIEQDYDGNPITFISDDLLNDEEYADLIKKGLVKGNILNGDIIKVDFESVYRTAGQRVLYVYDGIIRRNTFKTATHCVYDENGNDVSQNYEFIIGIEVSKWYKPFEIPEIPEAVYEYDGNMHYPNIPNMRNAQTPIVIEGNPQVYITAASMITNNTIWERVLGAQTAGIYEYTIMVTGTGRQPAYSKIRMKINQVALDIEIDDFNQIYDAEDHQVTYNVTNFNIDECGTPELRYYKKTDVSFDDLEEFYSNYSKASDIYLLGYESLKDAADYYAVVYYPESLNFKPSYAIKEVTIKRKKIEVTAASVNPIQKESDYNGSKYKLNLGVGTTFNAQDLIPGHSFSTSLLNIPVIQTISENAGTYYSQKRLLSDGTYDTEDGGFEFIYAIYDENANDVHNNYYPFVQPDCKVTIHKVDLTEKNFKAEDLTKEYDMEAAIPKVTTDADGIFEYWVFKTDDTFTSNLDPTDTNSFIGVYDSKNPMIDVSKFANAGYYRVVVFVRDSTNYNDLDTINSFNIANVTITPRKVEVQWENLTQNFNNTDLYPDAYILNPKGEKIILKVIFKDGQTVINAIRSGSLVAVAEFNDDDVNKPNYSLINYEQLFEIVPIKIKIDVEGETQFTNSVWSRYIDLDEITNQLNDELTSTIKISNKNGGLSNKDKGFISTITSAPGIYNEKFLFDFDIVVIDSATGVDISSGFDWDVSNVLIIKSNELEYKWNDITFKYDGRTHDIWEAIELVNPMTNDGIVSSFGSPTVIDQYGNIIYTSNVPSFKDVGTYMFLFSLTKEGYTDHPIYQGNQQIAEESMAGIIKPGYHILTVTIEQADSYLAFEAKDLNKIYDGKEVSNKTLGSSGGYNGTEADLIFEFYEGSFAMGTPMTTPPVDVGTYTVRVTSRVDSAAGIDPTTMNYTALDVEKTFTISPAELDLGFQASKSDIFDIEVNKDMLNSPYSITKSDLPSTSEYVKNLASGDQLAFSLTTGNNNIERGHHIATVYQAYDEALLDTNGYLVMTISADDGTVYSLQIKIAYNGNAKTHNYNFNINMDLYVHYAFIDATINDLLVKYDGLPHNGEVILLPCTSRLNPQAQTDLSDLTIYYSTTGLESDYNNTNVTYKEPGKYKIYYKMVDSRKQCHEDLYDSYYLEITKLERTYAGGIVNDDKPYDGTPWGILDPISGQYLPDNGNGMPNNYNLELEKVLINNVETVMPDDYDKKNVSILYHNKAFSGGSLQAINQGSYEYTITIPESQYYKETAITGEFKIVKAIIKIEGSYIIGYNGLNIEYSDFTSTNAAGITLTINGNPISTSIVFNGVITTTSGDVGIYSGNNVNNGLKWIQTSNFTDYYIEDNGVDETDNYSVNIENLEIEIAPAQMILEKSETEIQYDGELHAITLTMNVPNVSYKLSYSLTDEDISDYTKWSYTPYTYYRVGTYECYIRVEAPNYETNKYHATLKITRCDTTLVIPDLSREYSAEVLEPGQFYTNNTEVDRKNYTITYKIYDSNNDTYLEMDGNVKLDGTIVKELRPINVGKYLITVIIPQSESFKEVEASREFVISAATFKMTWLASEFVYNGNEQKPVPLFQGEAINKDIESGRLVYTINSVSTSDPTYTESINAGSYQATAVLDSKNYTFDESSATTYYQIKVAQAYVTASAKLHDTSSTKKIGMKDIYDSGSSDLDTFFTISGLQTNNDGYTDRVKSGTYFETVVRTIGGKTTYIGSYMYNSATDNPNLFAKNFRMSGSDSLNGFMILGPAGENITLNYNISYNLDIEIIYASLDYTIVYDKDAYGLDTGGVYTYDGNYYSYSLDVKLSNPDATYQIYIQNTTTGEWILQTLDNKPKFKDVPVDSSGNPKLDQNGLSVPYTFDIKVVSDGYTIEQAIRSTVSIRINQAPSDLSINFKGNLGKVYDGTAIDLPTLDYKDKTKNPNRVSMSFYQLAQDGVTYNPISIIPTKAGNYKLVLIPDNTGVYSNYTAITNQTNTLEYAFTIQKRPISFDLSTFDEALISKTYDGTHLAIEITNDNFVYVGNSSLPAIVSGDLAHGQLQTISADAGVYSGFNTINPGLIQYGSVGNGGFEIQTGKDDCYDIDWSTLVLEILNTNIDVTVSNIDVTYDGLPHAQTVEGGSILFYSPSGSAKYDPVNNPNGYRIYYGLTSANLPGFLAQLNSGNEESIDLSYYGFSQDYLNVAQTEITPTAVPLYIVITCKNFNTWVSNSATPPTIRIRGKANSTPDGITDDDKNNGYGEGDKGKPGAEDSPGGNGTQKPGTNDDGETSIFKDLQYDGNIVYNGNPYMNPSLKWQRNKPFYYDKKYVNDPNYEAAQHVTYYYYGTDFTKPTYYITQTIDGKKVGPVNENGSNIPSEAGEYIFILHIDTYDNFEERYFYQYFKIKPMDVSLEWGPDANLEDMLDSSGNIIYDKSGNPVKQVVFEYNASSRLPQAWYYDINGDRVTVSVQESMVDAGSYIASYLKDSSAGAKNYNKIGNASIHFVIKKKAVTDIIWPNDLTVEYGKQIELKDSAGNVYEIDKLTGKIIKISDYLGLPVQFNENDYPFTFEFSETIYENLDSRNPDAGSTIDVYIKLDDKANYMWASLSNVNNDGNPLTNNTESNDLVLTYTVIPRNLYDDEEWDYMIIMPNGSNQPIFEYTGDEVRPFVKVKLTRKDNPTIEYYLICNENEIKDASGNVFADKNSLNKKYDYLIKFEDNVDPTDDPNKVSNPKLAKIILSTVKVDGTNTNFVFGYEIDSLGNQTDKTISIIKEFRIQNPYPTTIQLTSDSIMKFIQVGYNDPTDMVNPGDGSIYINGYDSSQDGINLDSDGNDLNLLNRDEMLKTDSSVKDSIYLGRIHHETELSKYINQVANDKNRIIVYNQNGELVDRKYYDTSIFTTQDECLKNCQNDYVMLGTGWTIELYDEVIVEADTSSPEGYRYRGTVDADNKVFTPDTATSIDSIKTLVFGDGTGDGYITSDDQMYCENTISDGDTPVTIGIYYYAVTVIYVSTNGINAYLTSDSTMSIYNCIANGSGSSDDFNSAYLLP